MKALHHVVTVPLLSLLDQFVCLKLAHKTRRLPAAEVESDHRPHTQFHAACSFSTFPHFSMFIANIVIRTNGTAG